MLAACARKNSRQLANALLLLAVIASLIHGSEKSGAQLLLKTITVWGPT